MPGVSLVLAHDAIHANVPHLPAGQVCGYVTGTPDIVWTAADWAAHPGAVRIDQDPAASDPTADVLDVERGAATPADCAAWARRAVADFAAATRPGQRWPAIYTSASNVTPVVNALVAGGVANINLWVANWNFTASDADAAVLAASGPFPIVGVQFSSGDFFDTNVFSAAWLNRRSAKAAPLPQPGGPWTADGQLTLRQFAQAHATTALDVVVATIQKRAGTLGPGERAYFSGLVNGLRSPDQPVPEGVILWAG